MVIIVVVVVVVVVTEETAATVAAAAVFLIKIEIDQGAHFLSKHCHFLLGFFWYYLFLINWGLLSEMRYASWFVPRVLFLMLRASCLMV